MPNHSRILVALDGMSRDKAMLFAERLTGHVAGFKVNDLLDECGVRICDDLAPFGEIMADPKIKDIPNTNANRARRYARCTYLTVHASNTCEALAAARDGAGRNCHVLGITVLTSMSGTDCSDIYYDHVAPVEDLNGLFPICPIQRKVLDFAQRCQISGLYGVVCSPRELVLLRPLALNLKFITPGVRLQADTDDHKRVMSPGYAVRYGAYRIVVGREIIRSNDPVGAALRINENVEAELENA